jgi:hypothetical protein
VTANVIFYKSTMFKSKISSNALQGSKDYWLPWGEWVNKKVPFKEKKPPAIISKLTHGIEKSNYL